MSKTDLDLKADAYRLLLCMNYSTGIDVEVLGISEPEAPESGLARLAGVLPMGCAHWFANVAIWMDYWSAAGRAGQERIDPVAFGEWHYESQSSGLRDEVTCEMTCADMIVIA